MHADEPVVNTTAKSPILEVDLTAIAQTLERVRSQISAEDHVRLEGAAQALVDLTRLIRDRNTTIAAARRPAGARRHRARTTAYRPRAKSPMPVVAAANTATTLATIAAMTKTRRRAAEGTVACPCRRTPTDTTSLSDTRRCTPATRAPAVRVASCIVCSRPLASCASSGRRRCRLPAGTASGCGAVDAARCSPRALPPKRKAPSIPTAPQA